MEVGVTTSLRYIKTITEERRAAPLSTAHPPRPLHPFISAVVPPAHTCYGASIPSRRRPSPRPYPQPRLARSPARTRFPRTVSRRRCRR